MLITTPLNLYYAQKVSDKNKTIENLQNGIESNFSFYPWKLSSPLKETPSLPSPFVSSTTGGSGAGGSASFLEQSFLNILLLFGLGILLIKTILK